MEVVLCLSVSALTGRGLLELVALLLPPFPGFEQTSQVGEFTPPADGRRVRARDERIGAHRCQPLHFLSWTKE